MAKLWSHYTRELHDQLKYRGTWLPSTPVQLGSVGVLREGVLDIVTSLDRLGISYEEEVEALSDGSLDYRSESSVSVAVKTAGSTSAAFSVLAGAEAGIAITFGGAAGVVLEMRGVRVERIRDKRLLAEDLLDAVLAEDDENRWLKEWCVVTDVVKAESATVLVSQESGGHLELRANGAVAPASLAAVDAGFTVAHEKGVGVRIVAASGLTPLYNGMRVKRRFWSLYDQVLPAGETLEAGGDEMFGDLSPSDDLDAESV